MMQMSIAGDPQAIVDAEAYSDAHSDATKRDDARETKASAVRVSCKGRMASWHSVRIFSRMAMGLKTEPKVYHLPILR